MEENKIRRMPKGRFKVANQTRKYLLPELIPMLNVVFRDHKKKHLQVSVEEMKIIFAIAALDTLEGCASYERICDVLGKKASKLRIKNLRDREFLDVYNPGHPLNYRFKPGKQATYLFSSYNQSIVMEIMRLEDLGIYLKKL